MKKKVLLITGSGASISVGFPSVREIDEFYLKTSEQFYKLDEESRSPCHLIKKKLERHQILTKDPNASPVNFEVGFSGHEYKESHYEPNFEAIHYVLNMLISILTKDSIIPSNKTAERDYLPLYQILKLDDGLASLSAQRLWFLEKTLNNEIFKLMLSKCESTVSNSTFQKHSDFYNNLNRRSILSVATLNYDNVIAKALPQFDTGFDKRNGQFKPQRLMNDSWNTYLPLHGCVHFTIPKDKSYSELHWNRKPSVDDVSLDYRPIRSDEGFLISKQPLVIGYNKPDVILSNPYRCYFSLLERLIYEADTLLICGYGFGDLHLNRYLSALRYYRTTMTKRIVIINQIVQNKPDWTFSSDDKWTRHVRSVFQIKKADRPWLIKPATKGFMKTKRDKHDFWFYINGIEQFIESEELIGSVLQTK
ncbi:MAG: SIR2 family protein [Candidatus Cloacimonetes bacterium]|nr:SIR2 family protein [Candidatus Cloacimonadota bacterium]